MISRRLFTAGALSALATTGPVSALAATRRKVRIKKKYLPQDVRFNVSGYNRGDIVVDTKNHFLYLVGRRGRARRYGVGVGRAGLSFKGTAKIKRKAEWPRWTPTQNMIRRDPKRYKKYAKGVPGGPNNPLGARALYLYKGNVDTYYRIHGTNRPESIGHNRSAGCVRMVNEHVVDLYDRVRLGTRVYVL